MAKINDKWALSAITTKNFSVHIDFFSQNFLEKMWSRHVWILIFILIYYAKYFERRTLNLSPPTAVQRRRSKPKTKQYKFINCLLHLAIGKSKTTLIRLTLSTPIPDKERTINFFKSHFFKGLDKTFWGIKKKCENNNLS